MIHVDFQVVSTRYHIDKALQDLWTRPMISFDTETRGVYPPEERAVAVLALKQDDLPIDQRRLASLVANNTGLSFPDIVRVTHFVFGVSIHESVIIICDNDRLEMYLWDWVSRYPGTFLIHNTMYDLKIMYNRIKKLPLQYEDTALLAKCLLNNADVWKSRIGLKELMSEDYDPSWPLIEDYEPVNLRDPKFLKYASIDGAATFKLWEDMQEHIPPEDIADTIF